MDVFLAWVNSPSSIPNPIRSAIAHLWFLTIHPFEDGKELLENNLSKSLRRRYPIIPLAMELMPADIELFKLLL